MKREQIRGPSPEPWPLRSIRVREEEAQHRDGRAQLFSQKPRATRKRERPTVSKATIRKKKEDQEVMGRIGSHGVIGDPDKNI